jgi:peptidoglycan/xylan/chitin deacetylase (PgdA/CDA1 family)
LTVTKINPISLFNDGTWTISAGTGTAVDDTTNYVKTKALKVTPTNDQVPTVIQKTINPILNIDGNFIFLRVYISSRAAVYELLATVFTENGTLKYYQKKWNQYCFVEGWNILVIKKEECTAYGGATTFKGISKIKLSVSTVTGSSLFVTFGGLYHTRDMCDKGKIILTFDDNTGTDPTIVKTKLDEYGLKATFFVITTRPGTQSYYPTWEDYTQLYNEGHDVSPHTQNHWNLTTLDDETLDYELTESKKVILEKGFTRSADVFASPGGNVNPHVLQKIQKLFKLHRGVRSGSSTSNCGETKPLVNPYFLKVRYIGRDYANLSQAEAFIDEIIAQKGIGILVMHKQETTPSNADNWNIPDFNSLIDYIGSYVSSGVLDNITMSQLKNYIWEKRKVVERTVVTRKSVNRSSVTRNNLGDVEFI